MSDPDDQTKGNILYPAYINKSRTIAAGRRIPLKHAVADPRQSEVVEALNALKGFQTSAEFKPYCRELDKEMVNWRIRYTNTNPAKNNLTTKRETLVACAKRINEVRARSGPTSNQQGASAQSAPSGKSKKKNKS